MAIVIPEEPDILPTVGGQALMETGAGSASATDAEAARRAARDARAAARRERGGGTFPAAALLGGFLILLGGFFLIREFLPDIDFDLFWPLILVGLGIVLVVSAVRRPSDRA
jgi:hypothetical protein